MELRVLVTLQKIAELGSFSKAANELGYSQSTVTMQIKQLEAELSTQLFDRIGRKTILNNDGKRFLHYANHIIQESENALANFHDSLEPSGELRIGILESICTAYLPGILSAYHIQYPKVTTIIKIGTFAELSTMLNTGTIDLIWLFDHKMNIPQWTCAFLYESHISVVCTPNHPLVKKDVVTLKDISKEPLILTEETCGYRIDFVNALLQKGYTPNIILAIENTETIKKFVETGLGIAVLPTYTFADEVAGNLLMPLNVSDYDNLMYGQLFLHKNKWLSSTLNAFLELVKENVNPK